ncbi:MAG: PqqD family protein [Thermodesulfobacteriota bacterium]
MNKPRRKENYRLEMIDGELLLYQPGETKILYCNQTASLIWELCDGTYTKEEITTFLRECYPEVAGTIASDVDETLSRFLDEGAIELV